MPNNWKYSLFGCCGNPSMCIFATCIPCGYYYMHALNARVSKDKPGDLKSACTAFCCVLGLQSFGASFNRMRIREVYSIEYCSQCLHGNYIGEYCRICCSWLVDLLTVCMCPCCAVVQEWREVMDRERNDSKITVCNLNFISNLDGNITRESEVSVDGVLVLESPVEIESGVPMLNREIELRVFSAFL